MVGPWTPMATLLLPLLLFLAWPLSLAQAPGTPVPKPKPPEEPFAAPALRVEASFGGKPAPGILVILQPLAPNRLPSAPSVLQLTDSEGRVSLPLPASPERLLLSLQDRERGLRLQMPLAYALGTLSLGPYRFSLSLSPP